MATYTVQDSQTGKNVTFEWYDKTPPTDTDLQGIFAEVNKPQLQMAPSHKPVTSSDITALENVKKGIWSSTGGQPIPNEWDALAGLADAARIGFNSLIAAPAKQGIEAVGQLFWPREEARNIAAGVTAPMVTPMAPQAEQLTGAVSKPIEASGNWLEQNLGYPARFTFDTAMSALPFKGMAPKGPTGKVAPFTEAQAKAQNLAKEYDLPAFPQTLSNAPNLQGLANVFKSKVVPLFEKTHQVVKGLLDEVRSGFKTTEEQAQFLGEKGNVYDTALSQLPGSFDMPNLRDYFTGQMDALKEVQGKRALSKNEANLLGFYERMADKDAFSSADISEVNGKTPMPGNVKKAAMSRLYEDLKSVENGETVADVLKKTNQGYGFTKRSNIITGFLDKVMVDDRIDPARWMRLYDNFKIQNIAKMPDVFSNLDRVNDLVTSFSKELKAFNDLQNKPGPGRLETGLTRALEFGLAGTGGLPLLGLPGTLPAAGLAGTALGLKGLGGLTAKSATKAGGLLQDRMLQGGQEFGGLRDFITQGMEETGFPKTREWGKFGPEEAPPPNAASPTMPQDATLETPTGNPPTMTPNVEPVTTTIVEAPTPKPKKPSNSFQMIVRDHGGIDQDKWVAAGNKLEELPLGMRKRGGLGPDEMVTELVNEGIFQDVPYGVDSRDYFAGKVRDFKNKQPVTYSQMQKAAEDAILREEAEHARRYKQVKRADLERVRREVTSASDAEVSRRSDAENIDAAYSDPDFISEEDYRLNPEKYQESTSQPSFQDILNSGILPGTREWMNVWKNRPDLQAEMAEYAKKYLTPSLNLRGR